MQTNNQEKTILFRMWRFPGYCETFILSQIVIAIKCGYKVQILVEDLNEFKEGYHKDIIEEFKKIGFGIGGGNASKFGIYKTKNNGESTYAVGYGKNKTFLEEKDAHNITMYNNGLMTKKTWLMKENPDIKDEAQADKMLEEMKRGFKGLSK